MALEVSPAGELWAGGECGLLVPDGTEPHWVKEAFPKPPRDDGSGTQVMDLAFGPDGTVRVLLSAGMVVKTTKGFDWLGVPFQPYGSSTPPQPSPGRGEERLLVDSSGSLWIATYAKIWRWSGKVWELSGPGTELCGQGIVEQPRGTIVFSNYGTVIACSGEDCKSTETPAQLVSGLEPLGAEAVAVAGDEAIYAVVGGECQVIPTGAKINFSSSLLQGSAGELYVGTAHGALWFIPREVVTRTLREIQQRSKTLEHPPVAPALLEELRSDLRSFARTQGAAPDSDEHQKAMLFLAGIVLGQGIPVLLLPTIFAGCDDFGRREPRRGGEGARAGSHAKPARAGEAEASALSTTLSPSSPSPPPLLRLWL